MKRLNLNLSESVFEALDEMAVNEEQTKTAVVSQSIYLRHLLRNLDTGTKIILKARDGEETLLKII